MLFKDWIEQMRKERGWSANRLARDLGIPSSRGLPWERQVIKKILTNESYIGVYTYMDVRIEDAFPAILARIAQAEADHAHAARLPGEVKKLLDPTLRTITRKRILAEALAYSRVVVNVQGEVSFK